MRLNRNRLWRGFIRTILQGLLFLRLVLGGLISIGAGVLVGQILITPEPETFTGIVYALPYMILIVLSPVGGLMAWVASQPFLEGVVNIPMGRGIPDLSLSRLCVGFLFVLLMAQMAIRKRQVSQLSWVEIFGLLFGLGMAQSALNTSNPIGTIQTVIDLIVTPLLAYFIAKNTISNRQDLYVVLIVLILIGAGLGAHALYEQATGQALVRASASCADCHTDSNYSTNIHVLRGIFGSPADFGLVLTQLIPVGFFLLFQTRRPHARFFYSLALIAMIGGNYATFRRTAWIAMIVGFLILQWCYPHFRRLFIILLLVIGVVAAVYWDEINQSEVVEDRVNDRWDTANGRTQMWETMQRMWLEKPILGWGYAQYQNYSGRFRQDGGYENYNNTQSHYWTILVSAGLVGFLPFVGIILSLGLTSLRLARGPDTTGLAAATIQPVFWAALAAYLINNYTVFMAQPFGHLLFFTIAGALVGAPEHLRRLAAEQTPSRTNQALSLPAAITAPRTVPEV